MWRVSRLAYLSFVLSLTLPTVAGAQPVAAFIGAAPQMASDAPPVGGPGWTAGFAAEGGVQFHRNLTFRLEGDRSHSPTNEMVGGLINTATTSWSALFGVEGRLGRAAYVDFLFGGTEMKVTTKQTAPRSPFPEHSSHVAPTFGFDVPIFVSRHVRIVPAVRANFTLFQAFSPDEPSMLPRLRLGVRCVF
jgi:hypothetical protein